jgi:hypothetical protein
MLSDIKAFLVPVWFVWRLRMERRQKFECDHTWLLTQLAMICMAELSMVKNALRLCLQDNKPLSYYHTNTCYGYEGFCNLATIATNTENGHGSEFEYMIKYIGRAIIDVVTISLLLSNRLQNMCILCKS